MSWLAKLRDRNPRILRCSTQRRRPSRNPRPPGCHAPASPRDPQARPSLPSDPSGGHRHSPDPTPSSSSRAFRAAACASPSSNCSRAPGPSVCNSWIKITQWENKATFKPCFTKVRIPRGGGCRRKWRGEGGSLFPRKNGFSHSRDRSSNPCNSPVPYNSSRIAAFPERPPNGGGAWPLDEAVGLLQGHLRVLLLRELLGEKVGWGEHVVAFVVVAIIQSVYAGLIRICDVYILNTHRPRRGK